MPLRKRLISRYVIGAALPYVFLSLLLLTAIFFAQQTGRFAELSLYSQVPVSLFLRVAVEFLPNILKITLPVSVLAGIIIGFARMGSDSEIVAMRAAGVGTWTMLWPVLLIGVIATVGTTYLHMIEGPRANTEMRKVALQGALKKLESPVEPRTFNTDIPGYVIYVRDGNKAQGVWGRVFIYSQQTNVESQETNVETNVVTARSGRIDSSGDKSELVLNDAVAARFPKSDSPDQKSYVAERLAQLRIAIDTGRSALLERLKEDQTDPDELDWDDLTKASYSGSAKERREARQILNRRLALSLSPLVFAFFGGALGVRIRRGGRGLGVLLSLLTVIAYYLVSLLGESLTRNGTLSPKVGLWLATTLMLFLSFVLLILNRLHLGALISGRMLRTRLPAEKAIQTTTATAGGIRHPGFPSLLDVSVFRSLTISSVVAFVSLASIFIIFTVLDLWRFISSRDALSLVARYLLFLLPLITVELLPSTMLIAVLVTYALLARRNEAIAWWGSGQSVYRLMLPGLLFALLIGGGAWLVQEHLMPSANIKQDMLRFQIRGGQARVTTRTGMQWLASADSNRLYSYEFDDQHSTLREPTIYEFDPQGIHLASITTGSVGFWRANNHLVIKDAETLNLRELQIERQNSPEKELSEADTLQVFKPGIDKPSQLSAEALSTYLKAAKRRGVEVSGLVLALQRKYVEPVSVILMAFVGMPLALSFGRRGAIIALCVAVGVSVFYLGIAGGFQQLGNLGLLPPAVAAWAPPVIFAALGTYFLSRIQT